MSCAHVDAVEDLVLGLLGEGEAKRVRAHLSACDPCKEAHAMFLEERALFQSRAVAIGPAPYLESALEQVQPSETDRRTLAARLTPAVLAVAACVSALAGIGELHRNYGGGPPTSIQTEPVILSEASRIDDQPIACAFPVSGFVRRPGSANDESLACGSPRYPAGGADPAMCEEPLASWQR
jgi:hypothetical protein